MEQKEVEKAVVEDLLSSRIKVVAEYPAMDCQIGHIITVKNMYPTMFTVPMQAGGKKWQHVVYYEGMPHLFKPLQWWEDRKPEEMPKYIKTVSGSWVKKVNEWSRQMCHFNDNRRHGKDIAWMPTGEYLPATKEEYENQ